MVGIRYLIITKGHLIGMSEGGALWFVDLTTKDANFALPISVVVLSYLSFEIGLVMRSNAGFMMVRNPDPFSQGNTFCLPRSSAAALTQPNHWWVFMLAFTEHKGCYAKFNYSRTADTHAATQWGLASPVY